MGFGYGRCFQRTSKRLVQIEPRKDHFHAVRSRRMVLDLAQCSLEAITLSSLYICYCFRKRLGMDGLNHGLLDCCRFEMQGF